MKIVIVGWGSIGKKHAKCLQEFGDVEIAFLRTAKGTYKDKSEFKEFYSLEDAIAYNPDGIIIANPTSKHVETALPFLEKGVKALIEKPISHSKEEAERLAPYEKLLLVAYCCRFLPFVNVIREISLKESIYKLTFKRSYYLPKWHPNADYRTEYTAKKELGGGAIRTLSHEIDLMLYLFGCPINTTGVTDRLSSLEINTDDFAFFSCKTASGARINFELDFFSPRNINSAELFSNKGMYFWDMNELLFTSYEETAPRKMYDKSLFDMTRMYQAQIEDYIGFIKGEVSRNATYQAAVNVLKIIESVNG